VPRPEAGDNNRQTAQWRRRWLSRPARTRFCTTITAARFPPPINWCP